MKKNSLASHRKVKWRNERKKKTMVVEKNTKEYDACFQWRGDRLFSLTTMLTSINRFHGSPIPNQPWNPCTRIPFLSSGGTSAPRKPLLECVECVKAMLSVLSHGEHTGERACTGSSRWISGIGNLNLLISQGGTRLRSLPSRAHHAIMRYRFSSATPLRADSPATE